MEPNTQTAAQPNYASFGARLLALFLDSLLIGVTLGVLTSVMGIDKEESSGIINLVGLAYYVIMTKKLGYTLGKKALGIRVQNKVTGQKLTWGAVVLREVVGKILSFIPLCLGYFWMLWDKDKQTWHDKIGNSVVVKA